MLVVEPDWTTLGVASGDPSVTAIVLAVEGQIRHPGSARVPRLLVDADATDVIIDAEVHETDDLAVARFLALIDDALTVVRAEKIVAELDLTTWEAAARMRLQGGFRHRWCCSSPAGRSADR